ncbi:hypothetical protein ACVGV2_12625 [Bounagaea algeriensis]
MPHVRFGTECEDLGPVGLARQRTSLEEHLVKFLTEGEWRRERRS